MLRAVELVVYLLISQIAAVAAAMHLHHASNWLSRDRVSSIASRRVRHGFPPVPHCGIVRAHHTHLGPRSVSAHVPTISGSGAVTVQPVHESVGGVEHAIEVGAACPGVHGGRARQRCRRYLVVGQPGRKR
jgi:hypothetical protein